MEQYFVVMCEDVTYERSLILFLSLTDPDVLRQSKFTDHEIDFIKKFSSEKLNRQRILNEHVAMSLLESQIE